MAESEKNALPSPAGQELMIPVTGEIISLTDFPAVAAALESLRQLEYQIREIKAELTFTLVRHSQLLGSRTIPLNDGHTATVKGGAELVYDAEAIMEGLRTAGMPEERIMTVVQETVSYKVRAIEARRAASVNPAYKEVIERHSHLQERRPSVEIK